MCIFIYIYIYIHVYVYTYIYDIYIYIYIYQASAYEKQGRATVACLIMKFKSYRRANSQTPLTK